MPSMPPTLKASFTAISSRPTSSSPNAATPRFSISAWLKSPLLAPKPNPPPPLSPPSASTPTISPAPAQPSAAWLTCPPNRFAAKNSTPAPTYSPSAPCSTKWLPDRSPSAAKPPALSLKPSSTARLFPPRACTPTFPQSSNASSARPSKKIATSATRTPPNFVPILSACAAIQVPDASPAAQSLPHFLLLRTRDFPAPRKPSLQVQGALLQERPPPILPTVRSSPQPPLATKAKFFPLACCSFFSFSPL